MRLLNARTMAMYEFSGPEIPPYGILTHTWGLEEVAFTEFSKPTSNAMKTAGYHKIKGCCECAIKDGLDYVWVDTCCIDKRSSAELSEAINSMYRWYRNSGKCYAYLSDVDCIREDLDFESNFARSRWFTRGWTLQELIAPVEVHFFTSSWQCVGSKHDLSDLITRVTGIEKASLLTPRMWSVSVARRMSWASKRETTRIEDKAYCLLGIFGVNMPLLYGEGQNAFIRLQEEIMKDSDDQSLFAWEMPQNIARHSRLWGDSCGILASAPEFFANAGDIIPLYREGLQYWMTNKGLQIQFPLLPSEPENRVVALLECVAGGKFGEYLGITLIQNREKGVYWRTSAPLRHITAEEAVEAVVQKIYISKAFAFHAPSRLMYFTCWIRSESLVEHGFKVADVFPAQYAWDSKTRTMKIPLDYEQVCQRVGFLFCEECSLLPGFVVVATIEYHRDQGWVQAVSELNGQSLKDYMESSPDIRILEGNNTSSSILLEGPCEQHFQDEYHITADIQSKNFLNPRTWILTVEARRKRTRCVL